MEEVRPQAPGYSADFAFLAATAATTTDTAFSSAAELQAAIDGVVAQAKAAGPLPWTTAQEAGAAQDLLSFAESRSRQLRVVSAAVPPGILPPGCHQATLSDIRVKGRDDEVYERNADIWQRVARGNCVLTMQYRPAATGSSGDSRSAEAVGSAAAAASRVCALVVQSLRKFKGSDIDEDDAEEREQVRRPRSGDGKGNPYFLRPIQQHAAELVAMAKANGEAAHMSALWMVDRYVMFFGSKNVHMAATERAQIALYTDERFKMAAVVAHACFDMLAALSPAQLERLLAFLAGSGCTATFEMLQPDYLHVEVPTELEKTVLKFIGWTLPNGEGPGESLLAVHPAVGLDIARELGLTTVSYCLLPFEEAARIHDAARGLDGREGLVVYYVDREGCTLGLEKHKATWYVVLRACREKLRHAASALSREDLGAWRHALRDAVEECCKKMRVRMKEIAKFMFMTPEAVADWSQRLCAFIEWALYALAASEGVPLDSAPELVRLRAQAATPPVTMERIGTRFPLVWQQFVDQTKSAA